MRWRLFWSRPTPSLLLWLAACTVLPWLLSGCGGNGTDDTPATPRAEPYSVTARIGPAGGTLTGPDGAQVVVPAGALVADTTIGIARNAGSEPALDASWQAPAAVYEFTPHGLNFSLPVDIRMPVPSGATHPTVLMASTGLDWMQAETTVTGGFARIVRTGFSWGMVVDACASNPNTTPSPDGCFAPRGHSVPTATPASALVLTSYSNTFTNSAGTYRLDAMASLSFSATYNMWPSCSGGQVRLLRRQLDKSPQLLETLYSAPVVLQQNFFPDGRRGAGGSLVTPPITLTHLDQGRQVYSFRITCQRADGNSFEYGDNTVIHVAVPTPTVTHTIGGSVSGLAGSGLVLRNNGGDDLAITADGPFTFATALGAGTPYAVTVATQPAGQVCSIGQGNGTLNANVGNVAVSCVAGSAAKAWQGATLIENDDTGRAQNPEVAVDAQGNAIAVWTQHDGTRNNIWANRHTLAGGWGTPQRIETGSGNASAPTVALDGNGNAVALWLQETGSRRAVRSARYSGGVWTADVAVESDSGSADGPQLGLDASGNAIAVWTQNSGGMHRVRTSRLSGGSWSQATNVDGGVGNASDPQVKVFPDGTAMVVWVQHDGSHYRLFHNRFNGIGWSTADTLDENNTSSNLSRPSIAGNDSGGAIVVWSQGTDTRSSAVLSRRYSGGLWNYVVELSSADDGREPRISMNANGQAMVVWRESHNDSLQTWARRYSPDGGWDATGTRIDSPLDASSSDGPRRVGIDGAGNAIAIWAHTLAGDNHNNLYANRYDDTAMAWEAPQVIDSGSLSVGGFALGVGGSGHAIAVWDQDGGSSRTDLWANVLR